MKRKVLSLLLALALGLALLPSAALAAENIITLDSKYTSASAFSEGLAAVQVKENGKRKYGFINTAGQLVIPTEYDSVGAFSDGLAKVEKNGKYGLINTAGQLVIPVEYDGVGAFSNGLVPVKKDGKYGLVNKSGQVVMPVEYEYDAIWAVDPPAVDLWEVRKGINYGFVNSAGQVILPSEYNWFYDFYEGLAVVQKGQKYGFVNTAGQIVIPIEYDVAHGFSEGLAAVKKDGKWGYIDTTGKVVIPFEYWDASSFSEGLASVWVEVSGSRKYGFINTAGQMVIPAEYDAARSFSNGLAMVDIVWYGEDAPYWYVGVIDKTGKTIIPAEYERLDILGNCIVIDRKFLYDTKGNMIGTYDSAFADERGGVVILKKGDKCGVANDKGRVVIPMEYDRASATNTSGYITAQKDGKCGLFDQEGNLIMPLAAYYETMYISGGRAIAQDGKNWYILTLPTAPAPAANTAYASTQNVSVDGKSVEFQCYALKDENGNLTNYIKLRDLADILNGTAAQFQVGWDGSVTITTQTAYTANGSEGNTPYAGDRAYQEAAAVTKVNGQTAALSAFVLNDDQGGGYTYYQLRDLGRALGFNVGWAAGTGIYVETDKPYDPAN